MLIFQYILQTIWMVTFWHFMPMQAFRSIPVSILLKSVRTTTTKYLLKCCHVISEIDLVLISAYRYEQYSAADHFHAYIFCCMCICWDHRPHWKWYGQVCHEPLHKVWDCYSYGFHQLVCCFTILFLELLVTGFPIKELRTENQPSSTFSFDIYTTCFLL